jgi:methyl coenzyme M reductase alpha subunit
MDISPEVFIYLQTVKDFFKKNEKTSEYFLKNSDEDLFFQHLTEIAQKNFEKDGEPMLSQQQFELLRRTIIAIKIANTDTPPKQFEIINEDFDYDNGVFIGLPFPDFGIICLN